MPDTNIIITSTNYKELEKDVGTPTCQRISLFSALAQSISVPSLALRPFSGPQLAGVIKQATPAH